MQRRDFLTGAAGLIAINPKELSLNPMIAEKNRYKSADADIARLTAQWRKDGRVVVQSALYDRVRVKAGQQVGSGGLAFFTEIGAYTGKTLADTNLTQSQRLVAPEEFLALGVNLVVHPSICDEDYDALERRGHWQFMVGQRRYSGSPLALNNPQSLILGGGVHIGMYVDFYLSIHMDSLYTFKADADILAALPGMHAQGVC